MSLMIVVTVSLTSAIPQRLQANINWQMDLIAVFVATALVKVFYHSLVNIMRN